MHHSLQCSLLEIQIGFCKGDITADVTQKAVASHFSIHFVKYTRKFQIVPTDQNHVRLVYTCIHTRQLGSLSDCRLLTHWNAILAARKRCGNSCDPMADNAEHGLISKGNSKCRRAV